MRKRNAFDLEVLSTMDTLSDGMQSVAGQHRLLEEKIVGALKLLSDKVEALADSQSGAMLGLPLTATVVLSDGRKA